VQGAEPLEAVAKIFQITHLLGRMVLFYQFRVKKSIAQL
jgi:hypothetical protein